MDELLDKLPCGFLVVKDDGKINQVNETLLKMLGYQRKELLNLHIEKIFSVGGRIFFQTHIYPLLKLHGRIKEIYIDLKTKDKETVPVLINAIQRQRENLRVNDYIFVPIHRRNEFEDKLLTAKKEAEDASRAKDEFLSVVSHELRTPLNAILGWAKIVNDEKTDSPIIKKGLDTIQRNARRQTELIEDILDFSRIISGRLRLDVKEVDLKNIVGEAIDVVIPAADAKNILLQKVLDATPPISGDSHRLLQVLWNLLSNAVKFTPKGGRVQIRTERVNSSVQIIISDTGQGISKDFLPYVFQRFEQKDKTKTRRHGGLGLGMAITKHIVELHGGTIRAESPGEGEGATFTVQLPVKITHQREGSSASGLKTDKSHRNSSKQTDNKNSLAGIHILYVDDEADGQDLITYLLTDQGAEVTVAKSVVKAFEKLSQSTPDLIISDIEMPDEDGFSLMKKLKNFNNTNKQKKIPAIALTAHTRPEEKQEVLSAGFKLHLAKPVEPEELVAAVRNLLD